jgi:hypothetical protein
MRVVVAVLAAAFAVLPQTARAQSVLPGFEVTRPPPIAPADMPFYCVHNDRVYSLGSGLCVGRTPYTCVPATGPATGNRAYWTAKEDQVFSRPLCN